jgi:TIR domain
MEPQFANDDWDLLIEDIEQNNVVPVVGPDLLVKESHPGQTLYQWLADGLVQQMDPLFDSLAADRSLFEICSGMKSRELGDKILKLMRSANWPTPVPLLQLAGIGAFDLYVSTTVDSLLLDAVRQKRASTVSRVYGLRRPVRDIDMDMATGRLHAPVVFQVFGQLDGSLDCALSEEDVLQFMQRLQDPEPAHRPKFLFDILARRNLLFLGCGFPGWLGRFLRRVLKVSGELQDRGLFAHPGVCNDRAYGLFLERQGAKLWRKDTGTEFVAELSRRWNLKHPADESPLVFISYAREDEDVARVLTKLLEQAGVTVWLDQAMLRAGDVWNEEVIKAIEACPVFIPVISRHSTRSHPRYCHNEWDLVGNMPGKLICPLRADSAPLPERFAGFHAQPLEQQEDLVRNVRDFMKQRGGGSAASS